MKKYIPIIAIVLAVVCFVTIFVIVKTPKDKKDEVVVSPVSKSETKELVEKVPFEYKMVKLTDLDTDNVGVWKTEVVYVIELNNDDYYIKDVTIRDKNGTNIEESGYTVNVVTYIGRVCANNRLEHLHSDEEKNIVNECDRNIYTVHVLSQEKISTDELKVEIDVHNKELNFKETANIKENAKLDEITIAKGYVTDGALVELDGTYYIVSGDTSVMKKSNLVCKGYYLKKICSVNASDEFSGKIEFVNWNGEVIEMPKNCELYVEKEEELIRIGIKRSDNGKLDENQIKLALSGYLKYTDNHGHSVILFGKE